MVHTGWKVIVADRLAITRRAVATAIRLDSEEHEVRECGTAKDAMAVLMEMHATLLLVDLHAPGLSLVRQAREVRPDLKIVVLAGYDEPADALEALQAGADGFLVKGMFPEELLECLHCIVDTGVVVTSRVLKSALNGKAKMTLENGEAANSLLDDRVVRLLSQREREIFELMAKNYSNKEIAAALHISEQTVKVHVSHILTKLGEPNRAQAVIRGLRLLHTNPPNLVTTGELVRS